MGWVSTTEQGYEQARQKLGGKGYSLVVLDRYGIPIPESIFVTADAYRDFVGKTGLHARIQLELRKKDFSQMRWEEMWDAANRIRTMFLNTPFPAPMESLLREFISERFSEIAVAVRSSAIDEDAAGASFAGLHDSFVNLFGVEDILDHIRLVWSSLWSDAALLYRKEIGLNPETSAMAVVVQAFAPGERSGVIFTRDPNDKDCAVLESVYGLNQGLVDGEIEPDRWVIDRKTGRVRSHAAATRSQRVVTGKQGVYTELLPEELHLRPPLGSAEVRQIFETAIRLENIFGVAQDIEWTMDGGAVCILQSRPVTTLADGDRRDQRSWYLSLHRSWENLQQLQHKIEQERIPAMIQEADRLANADLPSLPTDVLIEEIKHRRRINQKWVDIYWREFIPFAHGVRLFGQVYNYHLRPENPYEFVDLLADAPLLSLERNRRLEEIAELIRNAPDDEPLSLDMEESAPTIDSLADKVQRFIADFGDLSCSVSGIVQCRQGPDAILAVAGEMAKRPVGRKKAPLKSKEKREEAFLSVFTGAEREQMAAILALARSSYRLRDDDNIYLGRIEMQFYRSIEEGRRRLGDPDSFSNDFTHRHKLEKIIEDITVVTPDVEHATSKYASDSPVRARQLLGHPAGPGIAQGRARVIHNPDDLFDFQQGEILICRAVDPNMTFIVPLSAAIVECRGGMLIHGAIIAREYGIPCVTGISDALQSIDTGDQLTVDGFLGIVTLEKDNESAGAGQAS